MLLNKQDTPEDILRRIEELQQWQEEQQQILLERQTTQRRVLDEEHRTLYSKLGFSSSPINNAVMISFNDSSSINNETDTRLDRNWEQHSEKQSTRPSDNFCQKNEDNVNEEPVLHKKPFLKRGEGLTSRFKMHPDKFRLDNLPKYKYATPNKNFLTMKKPIKNPVKEATNLKLHENVETVENVIKETCNDEVELREELEKLKKKCPVEEIGSSILLDDLPPTSWTDVLNPNNIRPISIESLRKFTESFDSDDSFKDDELENLSLFELLERKAEEGSILLDTSLLKRWVQNNRSDLVDGQLNADIIDTIKTKRVSPLPCDISNEVNVDDTDSSSTANEDASDLKSEKCVRFSDKIVVNEIDDDISIAESAEMSDDRFDYDTIRAELLKYNTDSEIDLSNTLTSNSVEQEKLELIENADRLKARLADLEREIAEFQKHNVELVKLKQECQLERLRIDQERVELKEKLADEHIKMEMEMHDERMRFEEEKKKHMRTMKETRVRNRKEDEEIAKLRERVEQLQKENREKDSKHTAAQARLRAQIRNLEKDLKEFSLEIDHLRKEKKQLETENSRLTRNSNNKVLQEINKSIAKLVPKAIPEVEEIKNKNPKSIVAKVTSHTNIDRTWRHSKPKSIAISFSKMQKESESINNSSDESSNSSKSENSSYFKHKRKKSSKETHADDSTEDSTANSHENDKSNKSDESTTQQDETKREIVNADGSKDIWYTNGNLKKISADGMIIGMLYYNKDIKETNINEGTVKYYYAETNTWHTTYLDGLEILEFPNGQTEHRYKDGTIEVHFDNGSIRITNPADPVKEEEWRYPDGTKLVNLKTGDRILSMPNGQKEIHTKVHKRREYPDGTVKIVYPDGSQETRYSNGRVRLKDKDGNLVMDSDQL